MHRISTSILGLLTLFALTAPVMAQPVGKPPSNVQTSGQGLVVFENQERRRTHVISFRPCGSHDIVPVNGQDSVRIPAGETRRMNLPVGCYVAMYGRTGLSFTVYRPEITVRPASQGYWQITTEPRVRWIPTNTDQQQNNSRPAAPSEEPDRSTAERFSDLTETFNVCQMSVINDYLTGQPLEVILSLGSYSETASERLDDDSLLSPEQGVALMQFQLAIEPCLNEYSAGLESIDNELSSLVNRSLQESNARARDLVAQVITIGEYLHRRSQETDDWREDFMQRVNEVTNASQVKALQ